MCVVESIYEVNGLVLWDEREILLREQIVARVVLRVRETLMVMNRAWDFIRIESPILTPTGMIRYGGEDFYSIAGEGLSLRPETTMGSYIALRGRKLPCCIWQHGKSFRREQTSPLSRMKLKEFYQLEFQCAYSEGTKADYGSALMEAVRDELGGDLERSERLPYYSTETWDIVIGGMEVCSMSRRADFDCPVFEISVGTDRVLRVRDLTRAKREV